MYLPSLFDRDHRIRRRAYLDLHQYGAAVPDHCNINDRWYCSI